MRLIFHADDLGITSSACGDVLSAWRAGALDSVSVIVNGDATDQLKRALDARDAGDLRIAVHLNLTEGHASADPAHVDLLVDDQGKFRHSFFGLLGCALFGTRNRRARFATQVETETCAQIRSARLLCGKRPVTVIDGHNHVHMIPGLFRAVARAATREGLREIRISREPFHIAALLHDAFSGFVWINLCKQLLLRLFSWLAVPIARTEQLRYSDWIVGILHSGHMTRERALRGIAAARPAETVEVVFHVGRAQASEAGRWGSSRMYSRFHLSEHRTVEFQELMALHGEVPKARRMDFIA